MMGFKNFIKSFIGSKEETDKNGSKNGEESAPEENRSETAAAKEEATIKTETNKDNEDRPRKSLIVKVVKIRAKVFLRNNLLKYFTEEEIRKALDIIPNSFEQLSLSYFLESIRNLREKDEDFHAAYWANNVCKYYCLENLWLIAAKKRIEILAEQSPNERLSEETLASALNLETPSERFYLHRAVMVFEDGARNFGVERSDNQWHCFFVETEEERNKKEIKRVHIEVEKEAKNFLRQNPLRLFSEEEIALDLEIATGDILDMRYWGLCHFLWGLQYECGGGYDSNKIHGRLIRKEYDNGFRAASFSDETWKYFYLDPQEFLSVKNLVITKVRQTPNERLSEENLASTLSLGTENERFYLHRVIMAFADQKQSLGLECRENTWYCFYESGEKECKTVITEEAAV